MSGALPVQAVRCQLVAIVQHALDNDEARLPIRAAFRDGLQLLERDSDRLHFVRTIVRTVPDDGRRR